jgi:hypothetical protein
MAAQVISIDRRQHPREGVMAYLEDITYAAVRRYGVIAEPADRMDSPTVLAEAIH